MFCDALVSQIKPVMRGRCATPLMIPEVTFTQTQNATVHDNIIQLLAVGGSL